MTGTVGIFWLKCVEISMFQRSSRKKVQTPEIRRNFPGENGQSAGTLERVDSFYIYILSIYILLNNFLIKTLLFPCVPRVPLMNLHNSYTFQRSTFSTMHAELCVPFWPFSGTLSYTNLTNSHFPHRTGATFQFFEKVPESAVFDYWNAERSKARRIMWNWNAWNVAPDFWVSKN